MLLGAEAEWFMTAEPTVDNLRFRADFFYRMKHFDQALSTCVEALAVLEAGDVKVLNQRRKEWVDISARCAKELGRFEEALQWATERVSITVAPLTYNFRPPVIASMMFKDACFSRKSILRKEIFSVSRNLRRRSHSR